MKKNLAIERAKIAWYIYRIELTQNYFKLDAEDIDKLEDLRKICNFSGKNELGRSRLRQFYYHLQKGWKQYDKMQMETILNTAKKEN